jgi:hypothetical protein
MVVVEALDMPVTLQIEMVRQEVPVVVEQDILEAEQEELETLQQPLRLKETMVVMAQKQHRITDLEVVVGHLLLEQTHQELLVEMVEQEQPQQSAEAA